MEGSDAWGKQIAQEIVDPFHVHNCTEYLSWLEEFRGDHPPHVQQMWEDVLAGRCALCTMSAG